MLAGQITSCQKSMDEQTRSDRKNEQDGRQGIAATGQQKSYPTYGRIPGKKIGNKKENRIE
jgi:hypothetical protein